MNSIDRTFERAVKAYSGPSRLSADIRRLVMTPLSTFRLMNGLSIAIALGVSLAVLGGMAYAAQDRYSLKLGKLSFGDFKGYED